MNPPTTACRVGVLLALAVSVLATGCRGVSGTTLLAWDEAPLPARADDGRKASLAPRTIPVEVRFVRHDPRDPAFGPEFWGHVDEQALDSGLRRRLEANGLRAGVVSGKLPAEVAARLEPAAGVDPAAPEDAGLRRLLRLLPGRRAEVIAAANVAELILLEHGTAGVGGATYRDATALFALQAWPDADGHVRIRLVPEVKHGAVQRSWVGEEGMFRLETGQARRAFEDLGFTVPLPAGGLLLVGTADTEGAAVGDALLRERSATGGARLLVVRPLAAGTDPLFASAGDEETAAADR